MYPWRRRSSHERRLQSRLRRQIEAALVLHDKIMAVRFDTLVLVFVFVSSTSPSLKGLDVVVLAMGIVVGADDPPVLVVKIA